MRIVIGVSDEPDTACKNCGIVGDRYEPKVTLGRWAYRGHSIAYFQLRAFGLSADATSHLESMHKMDYATIVPEVCSDLAAYHLSLPFGMHPSHWPRPSLPFVRLS